MKDLRPNIFYSCIVFIKSMNGMHFYKHRRRLGRWFAKLPIFNRKDLYFDTTEFVNVATDKEWGLYINNNYDRHIPYITQQV